MLNYITKFKNYISRKIKQAIFTNKHVIRGSFKKIQKMTPTKYIIKCVDRFSDKEQEFIQNINMDHEKCIKIEEDLLENQKSEFSKEDLDILRLPAAMTIMYDISNESVINLKNKYKFIPHGIVLINLTNIRKVVNMYINKNKTTFEIYALLISLAMHEFYHSEQFEFLRDKGGIELVLKVCEDMRNVPYYQNILEIGAYNYQFTGIKQNFEIDFANYLSGGNVYV